MRTGGTQALIMLTQGSSHSRVNWETSTICVTTTEVGRLAWRSGPRVPLSQMYQSVLSPDLLKIDGCGGGQRNAEERSECGCRARTMYRFKDKLVTVWISLGSSQCSEISSSHVSGYTVHEWAISWSIRPAHLNRAFVHQERAISSCFALSSGLSLRASRMCWALNRMSCIL